MAPRSLVVRFRERYIKTSGCWYWIGAFNKDGYGWFAIKHATLIYAHRMSYILHIGPIPSGALILHSCDNPRCVNPEHLSAGTAADNSADMVRKGRQLKGVENGRAKLTEKKVRYLKSKKGKVSSTILGKAFDVSPVLVLKIWRGEIWRHIT